MSDMIVGPEDALRTAIANAVPCCGPIDGDDPLTLRLAMLRLAAARLCPCPPTQLRSAAAMSLKGLFSDAVVGTDQLGEDLDALIGSGDLMRAVDPNEQGRVLTYLSPPMYVRRATGAVFITGGVPEGELPFFERVHHHGVYRELVPAPTDEELLAEEVYPFPMDAWMASPPQRTATDFLANLNVALDSSGPSGDVGDFEVFDPERPGTHYQQRWTAPKARSGRYLARRRNRWGARGWGFAELQSGQSLKWLSLPALDKRFRGCDEAWQIIYALDSARGKPQAVTVLRSKGANTRLGFSAPLPMWAEKRLMLSGEGIPGALAHSMIAFDVADQEGAEELAFLKDHLWVEATAMEPGDRT